MLPVTTESKGRQYHIPCTFEQMIYLLFLTISNFYSIVLKIIGGQNHILIIEKSTILTTERDLINKNLRLHSLTYCLSSLKIFRKSIDEIVRKTVGKKE